LQFDIFYDSLVYFGDLKKYSLENLAKILAGIFTLTTAKLGQNHHNILFSRMTPNFYAKN
jgi:hypothetical protein